MRKYTLSQLADYMEDEGLGYAIQRGLSPDSIEDERVSNLWRKAAEIMDEIEDILNHNRE